MADKYFLNGSLAATTHQFSGIWKLTRVMKAAGWDTVAHSDGTTKTSSGSNGNDSWGSNSDPMSDTYASITTTIAAGSNGASLPQATINVASAASFSASGTISVLSSSGWQNVTYTGTTGTTFTGCSGGTGTLATGNPVASGSSTVNFDSRAAWIVMSGPKTLKFPFTTAPTGNFVRGEPITQATSGATGELLGIVWDGYLVTGWAVVAPRTGTFDGSNVVTGSISSATFTPGSIRTFARQVMFAKSSSNTTDGSIYYVCANESTELTSLFSDLATQTGCTATVAPGAGGTSNSFPTIAISARGTGGSVSHVTFSGTTTGMTGAFNTVAANATPGSGTSTDGTFWVGYTNTGATNSQSVSGFFRLDNTEPGDIDPYVFYTSTVQSFSTFSRTAVTGANSNFETWSSTVASANVSYWKGYSARDGYVAARDTVVPFYFSYSNASPNAFASILTRPSPNPVTTQNHPSTTNLVYVRENPTLCTDGQIGSIRMVKGTIRWISLTSNGVLKDTFDNKKWVCIVPYTSSVNPGVIIGPWDGTTTPT